MDKRISTAKFIKNGIYRSIPSKDRTSLDHLSLMITIFIGRITASLTFSLIKIFKLYNEHNKDELKEAVTTMDYWKPILVLYEKWPDENKKEFDLLNQELHDAGINWLKIKEESFNLTFYILANEFYHYLNEVDTKYLLDKIIEDYYANYVEKNSNFYEKLTPDSDFFSKYSTSDNPLQTFNYKICHILNKECAILLTNYGFHSEKFIRFIKKIFEFEHFKDLA